MKLLVHVENNKILKSIKDVAYSINHDVEVLSSQDISSKFDCSSVDVFVVDKKTWQRTASILKYFKVLENLASKPMVVLTNEGKSAHLKFKDIKSRYSICGLPLRSEEFNAAIESLNMVGAEV